MNNLIANNHLVNLRNQVTDDVSSDTLCQLSALLNNQNCDYACYELVSLGIINSLKKKKNQEQLENSVWNNETKAICYQKLLAQDNCTSPVHIFLGTLTSRNASGEHWVLPAIAKEFALVLQPLYINKTLNKNAILCLIIVRNFVDNWISQAEISDLHINIFPEFTRGDLSLPYSNLFGSDVYYRNVNDLKYFIFNAENNNNLKLTQLLLITWLFNDENLYPYQLENLIVLIQEKISQRFLQEYGFEVASAKALLAHHALDLKTLDTTKLLALIQDLDNNNAFTLLLDKIADKQTQIRRSLSGNKTVKSASNLKKKPYLAMMGIKNIIEGHTNLSLAPGKKIKVAICISGQLRGYKQAFETWKKSILVGIDYDIYVHSWENIGGTEAEPFRKFLPFEGNHFKKGYVEYCNIFGFEHIKQEYPTLFKYLRQSSNVTEQEIKLFYGAKHVVLEDEKVSKFDGFSNSDKMHYKINACHNLMKSSNQHYDLVMRIRPDFSIFFTAFNWKDIVETCKAESIIYADLPFGTNNLTCMVGDQLAISSPSNSEVYADTWDIYPKISCHNLLGCDVGFSGHVSIGVNCWIHHIKVQKLPMKQRGLMDSSTMLNATIAEAINLDAEDRNSLWDQKFLALIKEDA